ncbi:MAG: lytic transglycosylase domain-containing protein [Desulfobacteraceae bacterium]|nr:lytic transglycosylase domain-containing protein [Desulfobacteraceae bacterium]
MTLSGSVKYFLGIAIFAALTLFVSPCAQAEIYVFIDKDGVMHFTNTPTSDKFKLYMYEPRPKPAVWVNIQSYDDVIAEASRQYGVAFPLIKAVIHAESCFNPQAVSKKGAMGLMQIMPENLGLLNINDPFDPWENIMGGARYLKAMMERFDGQLSLALAAYNAGPTAVERYNNIPPYKETMDYVDRVLKFYQHYKKS